MRCDSRARLHLAERAARGAHHRGLASSGYLQRCGGAAELGSGAWERCSLAVAAAEKCCVCTAGERRSAVFFARRVGAARRWSCSNRFTTVCNVCAAQLRREQFCASPSKRSKRAEGVVTVDRRRDNRSGSRPPMPVTQTRSGKGTERTKPRGRSRTPLVDTINKRPSSARV